MREHTIHKIYSLEDYRLTILLLVSIDEDGDDDECVSE